MKKNLKRSFAMIMSLAMLTAAFAACDSKGSTTKAPAASASGEFKPDTSKFVKLKSYVIGDPAKNEVDWLDKSINPYLKEKINANIEFASLAWADYKQRVPLLLAAGESFDMIYTSDWFNYYGEAPKGAFLALNDLLPKYAPTVWKETSEEGWKATKIDNKIFMVPNTTPVFTYHGAAIRGDLRKKFNVPEIKNMKDLGVYLDAIKKNMPELVPLNEGGVVNVNYTLAYENDWSRSVVGGATGIIAYDINKGGKLFDLTATPQYEAYVKRNREWYDKGYWSKNILANKTSGSDSFKNGQSAAAIVNTSGADSIYQVNQTKKTGYEVEYFSIENGTKVERASLLNNGTAIYKGSSNPERSLMYLELCQTDRKFFDLVNYGDPKKNNEITADGKVKVPEGANAADAPWTNVGMGFYPEKFVRQGIFKWDNVTKLEADFAKTAVVPYYQGFAVKPDAISAELAALTNVITTYKLPLDAGTVEPVQGLTVLKQKLKEAGIDKILAESQKQLEAYIAANPKK